MQPKSNAKFILALDQPKTFLAAYVGFKFFHYSSHCAHRFTNLCKNAASSPFRGGGTAWMQPKSNGKNILASYQSKTILAAYFGFKYFHYSSHCAHRFTNLCKNVANSPFRGGGTPWMQPKSNGKLKIASYQLIKFLATDFGFKCFHYSGHCAHRFTNLFKKFLATDFGFKCFHYSGHCAHRFSNLFNLQQKCCKFTFQGCGDTLDATQK